MLLALLQNYVWALRRVLWMDFRTLNAPAVYGIGLIYVLCIYIYIYIYTIIIINAYIYIYIHRSYVGPNSRPARGSDQPEAEDVYNNNRRVMLLLLLLLLLVLIISKSLCNRCVIIYSNNESLKKGNPFYIRICVCMLCRCIKGNPS